MPSHAIPAVNASIATSIAAALRALESRQLADGEFQTLLGRDPSLVGATFDSSVFVTAIICHALRQVGQDSGPSIEKALDFIEREREWGGLWRYYSSKNFKHLRLPPDLDDTCVASFALRIANRPTPANRSLILGNRDADGRFATWMLRTPSTPWQTRVVRWVGDLVGSWKAPAPPQGIDTDPRFAAPTDDVAVDEIDPVVNANVVAYLGDGPETAASVAYLRSLARDGFTAPSIYYSNPLSLPYAVARAFEAGVTSLADMTPAVVAAIARQLNGSQARLTPLTSGLGVAAHCTLQPPDGGIDHATAFILQHQQADGLWPREVFYNGPKEFWGSEELTTAICVEALARYRKHVSPPRE